MNFVSFLSLGYILLLFDDDDWDLYFHSILSSSNHDIGVSSRSSMAWARTRLVWPRAMDVTAVVTAVQLHFLHSAKPAISTKLHIFQFPLSAFIHAVQYPVSALSHYLVSTLSHHPASALSCHLVSTFHVPCSCFDPRFHFDCFLLYSILPQTQPHFHLFSFLPFLQLLLFKADSSELPKTLDESRAPFPYSLPYFLFAWFQTCTLYKALGTLYLSALIIIIVALPSSS